MMPIAFSLPKTFCVRGALFLPFLFLVPTTQAQTNRQVLTQMLSALQQVQTLKYRFVKEERFAGKMEKKEMLVHYRKQPFSLSLYFYEPNPGMQVWYQEGKNNNQAHIHLASRWLAWLQPDMDPQSKGMRKGEHHTLLESGLEFTRKLIFHLKERADKEDRFDELCKYEGEITWDNRKCHKLLLQYPNFTWEKYTLKPGESIETLARRLYLNPYLILERNGFSWYDKARPGDQIMIPNIYAKRVYLYVDKINLMPIYQEVHDDQGIFEKYSYILLLVNPSIDDKVFSWE